MVLLVERVSVYCVSMRECDKSIKPPRQMSLTNRPEFMSQSMPRGPMKRPKPREHEQDIPIEGARLIVKNLEFSVGASDLEELFRHSVCDNENKYFSYI